MLFYILEGAIYLKGGLQNYIHKIVEYTYFWKYILFLQLKVKNLLSVRRAQFPSSEAITRECTNPKNLDLLPRQTCSGYSHCQTLVLTDHNAGNSFILRGCAERFGAVDPEVLAKRKDNSCQRYIFSTFRIINSESKIY